MNGSTLSTRLGHHRIEVFGALALLGISFAMWKVGVSEDVAWFTGVMSVLLALAVAAVKAHTHLTATRLLHAHQVVHGRLAEAAAILADLSGELHKEAMDVLDSAMADLSMIGSGTIRISPQRYFHEIIECTGRTDPGSLIHAVNCIDILRWRVDPHEVRYYDVNRRAADRGVLIHRVFVLRREDLVGGRGHERLAILREQAAHRNITVHLVWLDSLARNQDLVRDWVMFGGLGGRVLVDFADPVDRTRVWRAEMILDESAAGSFARDFQDLTECSIPESELREILEFE